MRTRFPSGEASSLDGADKEESPSGSAVCRSLHEEGRQVSDINDNDCQGYDGSYFDVM